MWKEIAAVGCLLGLVAGLRVAYLTSGLAPDLAPDEAHYWDWSRQLDWGYYSKGPLVAWLIRLSCAVFGETPLAVRLPAVVCGTLLLAGLYTLARLVGRQAKSAWMVMGLALALPVVAVGGVVMTIDAPFLAAWVWGLVCAWLALVDGRREAWLVLGLVIGIGCLAKWTMLILPVVVVGYVSLEARHELWRGRMWFMLGIAGLMCLPMIFWNLSHDWVSFRHVGTQTGAMNGGGWRPLGPLTLLGQQAALTLGVGLAWAAWAAWCHRPGVEPDAGRRLMWYASVPVFGLFLLVSLRTGVQANWPLPAYVGVLILAVTAASWSPRVRAVIVAGVALTVLIHFPPLYRPVLASVGPLRGLDPTCRLCGWRELAEAVERVRANLRQRGDEPFIAGGIWTLPGELAFYLPGQPRVYSLGRVCHDRHSQYDCWHPNPIDEPSEFVGRSCVFVGYLCPEIVAAFDSVEEQQEFSFVTQRQVVARWSIYVGRGYRGAAKPQSNRY